MGFWIRWTRVRRSPSRCRRRSTRRSPSPASASFGLSVSYEFLQVRLAGAVEHLTLNRPEVRNAFNEQVIAELTAWADEVRGRAIPGDVRVVVLSGAGKMFCAGA